MRFPKIETDYWTIISAEERQRSSPDTFSIPPLAERRSLQVGDAVKLIFEIESEDEFGEISREFEQMWAIVSEVNPLYYIGRLDNMPVGDCEDSAFYLSENVEVPFLSVNIIEIDHPPATYVAELFTTVPKKFWPR
jgi:hypothetical protein